MPWLWAVSSRSLKHHGSPGACAGVCPMGSPLLAAELQTRLGCSPHQTDIPACVGAPAGQTPRPDDHPGAAAIPGVFSAIGFPELDSEVRPKPRGLLQTCWTSPRRLASSLRSPTPAFRLGSPAASTRVSPSPITQTYKLLIWAQRRASRESDAAHGGVTSLPARWNHAPWAIHVCHLNFGVQGQ